ncbi:Nitroreductase [Chitinophaga jiangningensis]|uniref:Nitroreductase n=1 Tax=Chitinophaga jiangningensis TaxID=1419482 RepID=A0A1M7M9H5_9BACT|nr:nitroreductase family protein [Chitinophaga jiangningensis]SHM86948.1 Nitroreductase [Chitinophaga jiangningensis]
MALLSDLQWRYATKHMNKGTVPQEKVDYILEVARAAPSSSGLQPYKIFVIRNGSALQRLKEEVFQDYPFNHQQIEGCSHLLVWAAWDKYSEERVGRVLRETTAARGLPDSSEPYKQRLLNLYESRGKQWQENHCAKQAYLSFGLAIAAAAELRVDATPMEGFDNTKMDEFLGLGDSAFKSVVVLPIGYRDEPSDWLVGLKKWRTAKEEFITAID